MRTNPISNRENRNFNVPKAGLMGAALGYAGTYAIPLTTKEHENYFTDSVKNAINSKVVEARKGEINAIKEGFKNSKVEPLVKDLFEKSTDLLESNPKQALKDLAADNSVSTSVKGAVGELFNQVNRSGNTTKFLENAKVSWAAKTGNRSALFWAALGMFVMMSAAVLKESLDTFFPKKPKEPEIRNPEDEVIDYIINAAEGPAELYILERGFARNKR